MRDKPEWVDFYNEPLTDEERAQIPPKPEEAASSDPETHTTTVEWDAEDEIFVAHVVERPECTGHGKTELEAIQMADDNLYELRQVDREEAGGPAMPALPADKKIYSQRDMEAALRELQRLRERQKGLPSRPQFTVVVEGETHLRTGYGSPFRVAEDAEAYMDSLESELQRVKEENREQRKCLDEIPEALLLHGLYIRGSYHSIKQVTDAFAELAELKAREAPEDAWKRGYEAGRDSNDEEWQPVPEYIAPERSK